MNYRHSFHAGNFADVFKHAVLGRILEHLRAKPSAFRVIDTHAGAGLYDLTSSEASRGGEWQDGIGRVLEAERNGTLKDNVRALLRPLLDVVAALNSTDRLKIYPGSPALVRAWLRPQDKLVACELEPNAAAALSSNLRGDSRIKTLPIDGWTAFSAYVPPNERRGLVLADPPFEAADEFHRLAEGLASAHRKWATGIYMLWYPIKDRAGPDWLAKAVKKAGIAKVLRAEILVAPPSAEGPLSGSGLIVVNPPWTLESELKILCPALARLFVRDRNIGLDRSAWRLDWLSAEDAR
jgi:23S rRNA (adenine2030-N6)-methyltransferase